MDPEQQPPQQIAFGPQPQAPEQINMDVGSMPPPMEPDVATQRATKAQIGLPDLPFDYGTLVQRFLGGGEQDIRKQAAALANSQKEQHKTDAILQIANQTRGRPLTISEQQFINKLVQHVPQTASDSVFEDYYAKTFMDHVRSTGETNGSIPRMDPNVDKTFFQGQDALRRQEFIRTQLQDAQADLKQQGWLGWSVDRIKELSMIYGQLKERDFSFGGGLGENISQQSTNYMMMPFDKFKTQFPADLKKYSKDNPGAALAWGNKMLEYTYSDKVLDNMMPLTGFMAATTAGVLGLAARRGGAIAAVKSSIRSSAKELTAGSMEEAAGNVKEAAILNASEDLLKRINDKTTPTDIFRGVHQIFKGHIDEVSRAAEDLNYGQPFSFVPPRLDLDIANRILERAYNVRDSLISTLEENMKVNRVPAVDALKQGVRNLAEKIAYPGLENRIMNAGIRYDRGINGHWVDYFLGDVGATEFKTERTANAFVTKLGLKDAVVEELPPKNVGQPYDFQQPTKVTQVSTLTPSRQMAIGRRMKKLDEDYAALQAGKSSESLLQSNREEYEALAKERGENKKPVATVEAQGGSFHVKVSLPLPETAYVVREGLLKLPNAETPQSLINSVIGILRTPNETLSLQQMYNRLAATYGPNNFYKLTGENFAEIGKLRGVSLPFTDKRQKWNDFKGVVRASKSVTDEFGEPKLLDPQELKNFYQNKVGRLPDDQEISAYYAYKRDELLYKVFDSLEQYKNLHRLGAQEHTIWIPDPNKPVEAGLGVPQGSKGSQKYVVNGTRLRELPKVNEPLLDARQGAVHFNLSTPIRYRGDAWTKLEEEIKNGETVVVKLDNPSEYPFRYLGSQGVNSRVQYVLSKYVDSKNIDWTKLQRNRVPDLEYKNYIAQPIIVKDGLTGETVYEGDRYLSGSTVRVQGRDEAKAYDTIREFLKNNDDAGARAYHASTKLAQEFDTIKGWFQPSVTAEGLPIPSLLDKEHKISVVPGNKRSIDMPESELLAKYKDTGFKDATTEGYGRRLEGQFGYKDFFVQENKGTRANPIFELGDVEHVDPFVSINRAMNRMIQSSFMNDYKIYSVEHWMQEAIKNNALNVTANEIAANPFHYFYNAPGYYHKGLDSVAKGSMETARLQIQQFLGVQNKVSTFINDIGQTLTDAIYSKGGTRVSHVPAWLLHNVTDPAAYVRSAVMDAKMGLFSPSQFMVQSQTWVNIFAISPKYALQGTGATLLHQWSRFASPEMAEKLDRYASKMGYKPGEFNEARDLLKTTGFEHVMGEYVKIDSPWVDMVANERQKFLDWGKTFFREGEKNVRLGAWYTAYKEFRDANPLVKIGDMETKQILSRADDLTANMSRASASRLQQGVFSIPFQFLSYQLRLADLFMGKRLNTMEKARLFGTYSALYGLPVAYGLSGFPLGDYIKRWAVEGGYDVNSAPYWENALTEGVPAAMMKMITGNQYNIGERYGIQGFEPIREALRGDRTFLDIVGGAAFSSVANTWGNMDGFTNVMMSMIRQDGKFKLKPEDFLDVFNEISSVSSARKMYTALQIGRWVTRNEGYIDDVSPLNSVFMTLSGLSPESTSTIQTMKWSKEVEKEIQKEALTKAVKEMRRGISDANNNDPEQANDRLKRALVYLESSGYPIEKYSQFFEISAKGYEKMIDSTSFDYWLGKDRPMQRRDSSSKAFFNFQDEKAKEQ